jgi:hypothetical protein
VYSEGTEKVPLKKGKKKGVENWVFYSFFVF